MGLSSLLRRDGRVALAPGAIRSDAHASVLTPEIEAAMLRKTPLGRLGGPLDMARAALFRSSPAASWVSGQVLTVSGGGDAGARLTATGLAPVRRDRGEGGGAERRGVDASGPRGEHGVTTVYSPGGSA